MDNAAISKLIPTGDVSFNWWQDQLHWPSDCEYATDINRLAITVGDVGKFVRTAQGLVKFQVLFSALPYIGGYEWQKDARGGN
jgi:hypothetical protein